MYCDLPQLARCCFCLPLRKGVLVFGVINILFSAFMVGVYSYCAHYMGRGALLYHGTLNELSVELSLTIYCIELVVNCLLVYGAYEKAVIYLKIYYYYAISTTVAALLLEVIALAGGDHYRIDIVMFVAMAATGFCIQVYLIILVRSLMKKLEAGGTRAFHNPLHATGERHHYVYNHTTEPPTVV